MEKPNNEGGGDGGGGAHTHRAPQSSSTVIRLESSNDRSHLHASGIATECKNL